MAWLTGDAIYNAFVKEEIHIYPFHQNQVNSNSYDYRLGKDLKILRTNAVVDGIPCIDPRKEQVYEEVTIPPEGYLLKPEEAYLGHTIESFGSDKYVSFVTGKSSIGRLFINNHECAGLIDQGFKNVITLEITVKIPVLVFPGMRFGQIFWFETIGEAKLYSGKYNQENTASPSKIIVDWDV